MMLSGMSRRADFNNASILFSLSVHINDKTTQTLKKFGPIPNHPVSLSLSLPQSFSLSFVYSIATATAAPYLRPSEDHKKELCIKALSLSFTPSLQHSLSSFLRLFLFLSPLLSLHLPIFLYLPSLPLSFLSLFLFLYQPLSLRLSFILSPLPLSLLLSLWLDCCER